MDQTSSGARSGTVRGPAHRDAPRDARPSLSRRGFLSALAAAVIPGAGDRLEPSGERLRSGSAGPSACEGDVGAGGKRTAPAPASGLRDPRLTARPHRPIRPFEPGETRLGPELDRGALLYVPEGYTPDAPAPLVVALHGGGGSSSRWRTWYDHCEERGIVLVAPDSRARTWDRLYDDFGADVRFLDAALRYTFDRCVIDEARVALAGFSDGASYALSLGPSNGDLFTHLIAFSPGGSDTAEPIVGRPRVFISHGSQDRVLPVGVTRDGIAWTFEMDGYDLVYEEFAGGHEMPDAVVRGALDWFTA